MEIMRESESLLIAFCGVDGKANGYMANELKLALDKLLPVPIEVVANIAQKLKERGYPMDTETTQQSQWAIEWAWLDAEQKFRNVPKIFCRSVVDRMAYNKLCNLGMDLHFEDMLPSTIKRYTVLFYTPVDIWTEGDERVGHVVDVDSTIRRIIKDYNVPVQVLCGDNPTKFKIALDAIKLRLGI